MIETSLPLTPRAKKILVLAQQCAKTVSHDYIGAEHILVGLLTMQDGPAFEFLVQCGVDTDAVKNKILSELSPPTEAVSDHIKTTANGVIHLLRKAADDLEAASKLP